MAMKLAVLAVLFVALIAAANATTYTTVVTTEVVEAQENPRGQQGCQQQVQQRRFRKCMQYMRSSGGQYEVEEEPFLRSAVANPRFPEGGQQVQQCCDELRQVNRECRCEAIRHMMREMQQQVQQEEMQEMRRMAEMLPQRCQFQSPRRCRISTVFF